MGGRLPAQRREGGTAVTALLPEEFADLEPFAADWCLPSERARYEKRLASSMAEMQAFYDAYLDPYTLDDMPQAALNLMYLLFSMITVSFPIECLRAPRVPDSGAARLDCLVGPVP